MHGSIDRMGLKLHFVELLQSPILPPIRLIRQEFIPLTPGRLQQQAKTTKGYSKHASSEAVFESLITNLQLPEIKNLEVGKFKRLEKRQNQ